VADTREITSSVTLGTSATTVKARTPRDRGSAGLEKVSGARPAIWCRLGASGGGI
jgi:hypothetical protein